MASAQETRTSSNWTSTQAYIMAVICLIVGTAVGYLVRGAKTASVASTPSTVVTAQQAPADATHAAAASQMPTPDQMQAMATQQAAPLLEKLKANPKDAESTQPALQSE